MGKTAAKGQAPYENPFHSGDRIRKAREHLGQDRQTFAETVGIHRDTLAKYEETGKAKRSALISIAWASKVRLEWLETGELPWVDAGSMGTPDDPNQPVNAVKQDGHGAITDLAGWRAHREGAGLTIPFTHAEAARAH